MILFMLLKLTCFNLLHTSTLEFICNIVVIFPNLKYSGSLTEHGVKMLCDDATAEYLKQMSDNLNIEFKCEFTILQFPIAMTRRVRA